MELALNEVKTQAKKLCKAIKSDPNTLVKLKRSLKRTLVIPDEIKLKHCLLIISQQLGFKDWHHAQLILSGKQSLKDMPDMGKIFSNQACNKYINLWFVDYQQAKVTLSQQKNTSWLVPFKKQFIVVKKEYLLTLNISNNIEKLTTEINHDLYQGYNSHIWDKLVCEIIRKR
jgi:hypothetical protein